MPVRPAVLVCLVLGAALLGAAGQGAATGDGERAAPPDPPTDVLGWEDGRWHNESVEADQSDGLSEAELEAVVARAMARVEYIRGLEFEATPEITFLTREEYSDAVDQLYGTPPGDEARLHQNTKFEALFLVGEDAGYFESLRRNRASFAAAFYVNTDVPGTDLSEGDLGVVLDGDDVPRVRESTLAHELVHAVQNQQFDNSELAYGNTEDSARAANAVVEGDASHVDSIYAERCGEQWDCLDPPEAGEPPEFANFGLVVYDLFVYGEGPAFVEHVVAERGWEGVDALYDALPTTTEQVIYPPRYPGEGPREVTVEDTSTEEWRIPDTGGVDYATFGESGLFILLWDPGYDAQRPVVMAPDAVFTGDADAPYNFSHPASEGWDGDRLYPYVNDSSAATNETGYVWKIAFESPADAREFARAYREVLASRGGERVGRDTWRLPENRTFGDAVHLAVDRDTVTVVNAPAVADLPEIRRGVTVEPVPNGTTTAGTATSASEAPSTATPPSTSTTAPGTPGFGVGVAAVGVAAALAGRRLRGRRR